MYVPCRKSYNYIFQMIYEILKWYCVFKSTHMLKIKMLWGLVCHDKSCVHIYGTTKVVCVLRRNKCYARTEGTV